MSSSSTPSYPGAEPPPPGVTPDLNRGMSPLTSTWLAAHCVELVVPTILVVLRLYIRGFISKQWNYADVTCTLAWVFFVCVAATGIAEIRNGVGIDAWDLTPETFGDFLRVINWQQIFYMPAVCLTKVTILLQFINMFSASTRSGRWWSLVALISANIAFFLALMFVEIFQCVPREKIWNSTIDGKCINIQQTFIATGVINVVDDLAIIAMPIIWVSQLRVNKTRKLSMIGIFAVGIFACVCSIMRLAESALTLTDPNISVAIVPVSLWATAEISSGLVVACLPFMPRLFRRAVQASSYVNSREESYKKRASRRQSRRHWFSTVNDTVVGEGGDGPYFTMDNLSDETASNKALAHEESQIGIATTKPFAVHHGAINKTVEIEQTETHIESHHV